MKAHALILLLCATLTTSPHAEALTQTVRLTNELDRPLKSINQQFRKKLSDDDYAELLKGELVWPGDIQSLKVRLQEILQATEDDDVFSRAYIEPAPEDNVTFRETLQTQQEPILYADRYWVITRANGKGKFSSRYTFWNAVTGLPGMKLHLPGNVYCPVATNIPGIYALRLTTNRRASEDFSTWHGIPCTVCYARPSDKSFATYYTAFDSESTPCPEPKTLYKGLVKPGESYYLSAAAELEALRRSPATSIAESTKAKHEIQKKYEAVGTKYDIEAALPSIGRKSHLIAPIANEFTAAYRLPQERRISIAGDNSGKTASFAFSVDGCRYVSVDFDTLSRTVTYMPEARNIPVDFNPEGKLTTGAPTACAKKMQLVLSPLPARLNPSNNSLTELNKITSSNPDMSDGICAFACNTGNYAWNVYEGAVVDELFGIKLQSGKTYILNPNTTKPGDTDKLLPLESVMDKRNRGIIRGGTGAVQYAGQYSMLSVIKSQDNMAEVLLCKQYARNKQTYIHLSIDTRKATFTVLRRWESVVHRINPVWIARKQWLLQPISDNAYTILHITSDKEPQEVAKLFVEPMSDGYALVLPDGRYAGSPGCESFLRVNINGQSAGLTVFAPWRNRPSDVLTAINGSADDIAALKETTNRWLKKQGYSLDNMPEEPKISDLPTAKVAIPGLHPGKKIIAVNVTLKAGKNAINRLELRTDGVLQPSPAVNVKAGASAKIKLNIPLASGQNNVEITPLDTDGVMGDSVRFRIMGPRATTSGNLYVVALGVSEYDNEDLRLQYAAKDATDVTNAFRTYGLGTRKYLLLLKDQEVKDASVMEKVKGFLKHARPEDRVVLYLAGHGMLDENLQYFYAPAAFDVDNISGSGISMDEFRDCLQSCAARYRLLLLDTCHAGSLGEAGQEKLAQSGVPMPGGVHTRGMKIKKAASAKPEKLNDVQKKRYIEDFFSMDSKMRGINVLAASAGAEFAQESGKWKNGVFTSSIMRALSRRAAVDGNADGILSVEELLHYVSADVSTLTAHTQKPSVVSAEDTQGFHLSADLARYVNYRDWAGLKRAAAVGIGINEGAYPDTEGILCKALQLGAPEDVLTVLLENGANVNREQRVIIRGTHLQEQWLTPRILITQDNSYVDFDGSKVDFCTKYGYSVLALRRMFQPYYAKHKKQFAQPEPASANTADKGDDKEKKTPGRRLKSRFYQ